METVLQVEAPARAPADGVEDVRNFTFALRPTRNRQSGELLMNVAVSCATSVKRALVIEDIKSEFEYLDADVLVLRIDLVKNSEKPWTMMSKPHPVENGDALKYVALMYGPKGGPLQLVAVKLIEYI